MTELLADGEDFWRRYGHRAGPALLAWLVLLDLRIPLSENLVLVLAVITAMVVTDHDRTLNPTPRLSLGSAGQLLERPRAARLSRIDGVPASLAEVDAGPWGGLEKLVYTLFVRDGYRAEHTGGPGDKGVDVKAVDRWGRTIVIQCKHTRFPFAGKQGRDAIAALHGVADPLHKADFAIVVTNRYDFSRQARIYAAKWKVGVGLIDRTLLHRWIEGEPLHELLPMPSPEQATLPTTRPGCALPAPRRRRRA